MFSERLPGNLDQRPQFGFAQVTHEGLGAETDQDDSVAMKGQATDLILQVCWQASIRTIWVGLVSVRGFVGRNEDDFGSQPFRTLVVRIHRLEELSRPSGIQTA